MGRGSGGEGTGGRAGICRIWRLGGRCGRRLLRLGVDLGGMMGRGRVRGRGGGGGGGGGTGRATIWMRSGGGGGGGVCIERGSQPRSP